MRRLIFWYDVLSDWQRVQYAVAASLFLLACGGYLLGLGSTMVLQRVESEDATLAALAAQPLNTPSAPTATVESLAIAAPTPTPTDAPRQPSPTAAPTGQPTRAPFSGPVIAEPPAVPRVLPASVPPPAVAPVVRESPTADKPRNLETSKPEPPSSSIATSTPGSLRTALPTAVRQPTTSRPTTPTVRTTPASTTPLPTLALPATPTPGTVPTPAPATPAPTRAATSAGPPPPTPVRTPPPR